MASPKQDYLLDKVAELERMKQEGRRAQGGTLHGGLRFSLLISSLNS